MREARKPTGYRRFGRSPQDFVAESESLQEFAVHSIEMYVRRHRPPDSIVRVVRCNVVVIPHIACYVEFTDLVSIVPHPLQLP
jgi:hypothetical protein